MSSLGQLVIELAANTARLQSDLGKAVSIAESAAGKMKAAFKFAGGGLISAFLVGTAKQAIEFGDSINKAAIKAGVGTKAMSELAYAAKLADVDIASLSTAFKKMQVSLSEAATGGKQQAQTLQALGIALGDIQKRNPVAQFELLGDRISKLQDPADRARAATELFGKAGADLLPLFEQGAAGIAKARAEAEKLGLSFGDDTIKKLSNADDAAKRLSASWQGFAATLTGWVAPAISTVLDGLSGLDTRSVDEKIADLQAALGPVRFQSASKRADLQSRLNALRGRKELEEVRAAQTGTSGGPLGRRNTLSVIGYGAADAAEAARAAAKKASAEALKEQERAADQYRDMILDLNRDIGRSADDQLHDDMEREAKRLDMADEWYETWVENEKKLAEYRSKQAQQLSEGAQIWKDTILRAFDDMVNNGKIKWKELLKFMAAETVRLGIEKVFSNIATKGSSSGGGGSKGGFWSGVGSLLGSVLGGFKADGGSVQAGRSYVVGERGREVLTMGANGYITPNGALGGGVTIAPNYHINNPNDTASLPRILRENNRQLVEELSRAGLLRPA
jgi:hypothetical protein